MDTDRIVFLAHDTHGPTPYRAVSIDVCGVKLVVTEDTNFASTRDDIEKFHYHPLDPEVPFRVGGWLTAQLPTKLDLGEFIGVGIDLAMKEGA